MDCPQLIQQCSQIILLNFWLFGSFSSNSNWNNFTKTFQLCQNQICNNILSDSNFHIAQSICVIFCHYSQLNKGQLDIFNHRQWCLNNKQSRFFTSYVDRKHSTVAKLLLWAWEVVCWSLISVPPFQFRLASACWASALYLKKFLHFFVGMMTYFAIFWYKSGFGLKLSS